MEILLKKTSILDKIRLIKERKKEKEYNEKIINNIIDIKKQIESAQSRFNLFCDSDLIESAIYEEKALQARYAYLMTLARKNKVYSEMISEKV